MAKESRKKYLIKNTLVFSIGNFGSKIIAFFLVPLYTNVFTTSQYGIIDLMTVLTNVIVPIITLNISEAIMRYLMDKSDNKNDILNISIIFCVITFLMSILFIPIFNIFNITSNYSLFLAIYIFSFSISNILLCYIRGIEKLIDYSIINIIQTLVIAILNILFLLKFNLGIQGYILAYSIAYILSSILCILVGKIYKDYKYSRVNKKLLNNMIKYSSLLIPNALMWWIMNSLDRVMITSMISVESNGIYSVSYKIPTILMTVTLVFNQAWMFSAVKEKDSVDKNEYTNKVLNCLSSIIILTASFLIVILKPLMKIYVGNDFYSAWKCVPPLLIGTVFLTLGTFLSNEYTVHKDSTGFLKSSTIGAIVNLTLNFILIRYCGIIGAAIATCISYLSVLVFRIFDTKKYVKIEFKNSRFYTNFIGLFLISLLVYFNNIYLKIIMLIIFLLLILTNYLFYRKSILILIEKIRTKINCKF